MSRQVVSKNAIFRRQALILPASFIRAFEISSSRSFHGNRTSTFELPLSSSAASHREHFLRKPLKWLSVASCKPQAPATSNPGKKPNDDYVAIDAKAGYRTLLIVPAKKRSANCTVTGGPAVLLSQCLQAFGSTFRCQPQVYWTGITFSKTLHSAVGDDDDEDKSDDLDDFPFESEASKVKGRSSPVGNEKGVLSTQNLSDSEDDEDVTILTTTKRKRSAIAACEDSDSDEDLDFGTDLGKRRKAFITKAWEDSESDGDEVFSSRGKSAATLNGKLRKSSSDSSVADSKARFAKKRPAALEYLTQERPSNAGKGNSDRHLMPDSHFDEEDKDVRELNESPELNSVSEEGSSEPSYLTKTRFDKFPISPLSIKVLHSVLKYERMTEVQEATFPVILKGQDVLAKARTGTGKTIAFLLPAIEAILKAPEGRTRNPIYVLIVCPTRELAQQAATEAKVLLQFHRGLGAQVVYGGCSIRGEQMNLSRSSCQILVGTPGRLVDHIQRTPEMARQLKSVQLFVLDEADRMLDMGFRDSLQKIMDAIPSKRQTLLFSATIPKEVHSMVKIALRNDHVFIDAVGKDSQDTHMKVKQQYIMVPLEKQIRILYATLQQHMEADSHYKVLVFCSTARTTGFMCKLFMNLGFNAREIHSRKDQSYRTRVSDEFRHSKGGIILFTSDVSARGVDYPNVTLVVQVGAPSDFEQYIHRLGRTGRAGKKGEGLLILAPWEDYFLQKLSKLPITALPPPKLTSQAKSKILSAASLVDESLKEMAYTAWLGYYRSLKGLSLDKAILVEYANQFSASMGLDEPPALSRMFVSKMALNGVPGVRLRR